MSENRILLCWPYILKKAPYLGTQHIFPFCITVRIFVHSTVMSAYDFILRDHQDWDRSIDAAEDV